MKRISIVPILVLLGLVFTAASVSERMTSAPALSKPRLATTSGIVEKALRYRRVEDAVGSNENDIYGVYAKPGAAREVTITLTALEPPIGADEPGCVVGILYRGGERVKVFGRPDNRNFPRVEELHLVPGVDYAIRIFGPSCDSFKPPWHYRLEVDRPELLVGKACHSAAKSYVRSRATYRRALRNYRRSRTRSARRALLRARSRALQARTAQTRSC